jgi:hypothetical protein
LWWDLLFEAKKGFEIYVCLELLFGTKKGFKEWMCVCVGSFDLEQ